MENYGSCATPFVALQIDRIFNGKYPIANGFDLSYIVNISVVP